jgi:PAS domain S-box-containing protein
MKLKISKRNYFSKIIVFPNLWKAIIVLIIGLILTGISLLSVKREVEDQNKKEFALICDEIKTKIDSRLHAHAQLLRSASALFAANKSVNRYSWKEFNYHSKIENNLPGIQGVGFSIIIPKNLLLQHIKDIRNEGFPEYAIKPVGKREIYTSIIYLEPFTGRNLRAFGYDMFTDSIRRKAMEFARDNDVAMLSGKVMLVQETQLEKQSGTLMYVPVYTKNMPVNTLEQRRAAIKGWVYSPYRMNDLMVGILGNWDKNAKEKIHFQIFDDSISESLLIFDNWKGKVNQTNFPLQEISIPIEFNGKKWILHFTKSNEKSFIKNSEFIIVLVSGILISLLLFLLSLSLLNISKKSREIAGKLTSKLKEEQWQSESIVEGTNVGTWEWNIQTGEANFNKLWAEIIGYKLEELIPISIKTWKIHVHPDDLILSDEHLKRHFTSEIPNYDFECRMKHKNGNWVWVHDRGRVITRTEDGKPLMMFGTHTDITIRKQAEEKIRESEQRFRLLADNAPVLLWKSGTDALCDYFNKPWLDFTGRTLEQELGNGWVEGVHPDDFQHCLAVYMDSFKEQKPFQMEYRLRRKDSEFRWLLDYGVPRFTLDGVFLGFIGSCIDITERKRSIDAIAISEIRYRKLFESAKDGILILDAETGMIDDVNPFLIQMLGFSKDQFVKKAIWEIGFFKDVVANHNKFDELQQNKYIRYENLPLETAYGHQINVEFVSNLYVVDNKKVIQCNIRDITERRLAEEALIQSEEKLRELNATKDKFFSIIAHDLKSPFNSIVGFSDLLVEQVNEKNYEGIEKYAEIIMQSSGRAMNLLMNLMEWSQSQTGRMEFNPIYLDFTKLINEVIILFNDISIQKSIKINKSLPEKVLIFADAAMINTVLRNLISNAIKFTNTGGEINILLEERISEVLISVSDNGIGISNQLIGKLFRIDESYSTSGTNNEKGTGLGLILCKDFINKHNGRIWIESEIGKGSTICFTIPIL